MILTLLLVGACFMNICNSYNSESSEGNRIEFSPFYDTIIFSDIADIIKDFENNKLPTNSESENEENIEDLLSEYQHYLDKAHKQKLEYLEKTKTKNKVPLFRHDKYSKLKPYESRGKYDNFYYANSYYVPTPYKLPQQSYNSPLDLLIPLRAKERYMTKLETTTPAPLANIHNNGNIHTGNEYDKADLTTGLQKHTFALPKSTSCYCKKNQIPCECSCKQCLVVLDKFSQNFDMGKTESIDEKRIMLPQKLIISDNSFYNTGYLPEVSVKDVLENINVKIKVDIQFPKQGDIRNLFDENHLDNDDGNSKEMTSFTNLPYYNFPIPIDMFGYKKSSKLIQHDLTPFHKITIRKKKSKVSNGNKKHRKKVKAFHNIKVEPRQYFPTDMIASNNTDRKHSNKINDVHLNVPIMPVFVHNKSETVNDTQKDINTNFNVTKKTTNVTEKEHKSENSIEAGYFKLQSNLTTTEKVIILRVRRDTENFLINIQKSMQDKNNLSNPKLISNNKDKKLSKSSDKHFFADAELLYWPTTELIQADRQLKNITYRIIEFENKKTKLNMSKEIIHKNHTRALEQAIFGKADWNDVDAVAPEFISFFGKYTRGVLTFCTQTVCHSMKCAEIYCVHRICTPKGRWNNKGHCSGSNITDSVVSMESIMDLPSNIAFEIVDILQEKMLGKLYGKMTLCIIPKCITFATSKKNFIKSKCNAKELNSDGQCPITNVKIE